MESAYQHCRNKTGMNGVVVWEENSLGSHVLYTLQIWSIHVVNRTRTAKKCAKMQNARPGRAEPLFLFIEPLVLWRSRSRRRRLA